MNNVDSKYKVSNTVGENVPFYPEIKWDSQTTIDLVKTRAQTCVRKEKDGVWYDILCVYTFVLKDNNIKDILYYVRRTEIIFFEYNRNLVATPGYPLACQKSEIQLPEEERIELVYGVEHEIKAPSLMRSTLINLKNQNNEKNQ